MLVFFLLLIQVSVKSQGDWILKKNENGIKVFTRPAIVQKFDELKAECVFGGRISQLAAVLLDVNNHTRWSYKTLKSQLLQTLSPTDFFYYTEIKCPWPFQNRDVVSHFSLKQDIKTRVLTVEARDIKGYLPDKPGITRLVYSRVDWIITPLDKKRFKVEYRVQVDPGGSAPTWILNLFATKGPYESLMKLREEINRPPYLQAKFSFVVD